MTVAFRNASMVYGAAQQAEIFRIRLKHPLLARLHKDVGQLDRMSQETQDELEWGELVRRFKRYRFLTAATPLVFNHPFLWDDRANTVLKRALHAGSSAYPSFRPLIENLQAVMQDLQLVPSSPLWDAIQEHGMPTGTGNVTKDKWAILLADTRSTGPVEALAAASQRLDVATAPQLQDDFSYTGLYVLGSTRWFPGYCFTAARAQTIQIIQFEWALDNPTFPAAFLPNQKTYRPVKASEVKSNNHNAAAGIEEEPEMLQIDAPEIDWGNAFKAGYRAASGVGGEVEDVPGHLYVLEGGWGVWLEDSPSASVLTIRLRETGELDLQRLPVRQLRSGAFVLLRTGGGGDLIVPVADRMLGNDRKRLRNLQTEWKQKFRKQVRLTWSTEVACKRLSSLGAVRAKPSNVRNWMALRTIRPDSDQDFKAVLEFSGLQQRAQEFFDAMAQIDNAHRRAGHQIGQMILNTVSRTDTTPLRRQGVQVFEAPQGEGGSFTAYRLLERSQDTGMVTPHRLAHIFPLED